MRNLQFTLSLLGAFFVLLPSSSGMAGGNVEGAHHVIMQPPPVALDDLYPPHSQQPVYLIEMLTLDKAFTAIVVDLLEDDLAPVPEHFEEFKRQYEKVAKLVPDWGDRFPAEPINDLDTALKSSDRGKVMGAYGKVGQVCTDCHLAVMPQVKFKYHWGDFSSIQVQDPVTKQEMSFGNFKHFLDGSLNGIMLDVQQGQVDRAKQHLRDFRARFGALEESCNECHDSERDYYVGESVAPFLNRIAEALEAPSVDPQTLDPLLRGFGTESCLKCHSTHGPAAIVRTQWGR